MGVSVVEVKALGWGTDLLDALFASFQGRDGRADDGSFAYAEAD